MDLPGITHQYGPWSPARFIPVPFRADDEPPAFWLTTARVCRGGHDWRCTQTQTQTFGPLVLQGRTKGDLSRCDNCHRVQPPVDLAATGEQPVCLFCSDMATVQHLGDEPDSAAAVSAAAALHAASSTLRQVKEVDPSAFLALLDECGDMLRGLMDDASWAIRQAPERAKYSGYAALVIIARQICANARTLAELSGELLPVKENDEGE